MLVGEELAGAAIAALDLVEDQQHAMLVAGLAQPLDELGRAGGHSPFALHRLDHETGSVLVDERQRGREVVEWRIVEAGQQRLESIAHLRLVGRRDRPQRPTVKALLNVMIFVRWGLSVTKK
jgi:hypothetical protein